MKEHVFSTQFVMKSKRVSESLDGFYDRIRETLYDDTLALFEDIFGGKDNVSKWVDRNLFMARDSHNKVKFPAGGTMCVIRECQLDGDRVFVLTTVIPRGNKWYKYALDHSLCTEIIVHLIDVGARDFPPVKVSVCQWVEYQPFAGFFKTRKLPRIAPKVCDRLLSMVEIEMTFAPRCLGKEESLRNVTLSSNKPLFYPIRKNPTLVCDEETLSGFKGHIEDFRRPIPLVVFFGNTKANWREAKRISESCWAKCRVWILERMPGLDELLVKNFEGIDVAHNFRWRLCRILFPRGEYRQDDLAQPRYWVPVVNRHHFRKRIMIGLTRFYHFNTRGWITSSQVLDLSLYEVSEMRRKTQSDTRAAKRQKRDAAIMRQILAERDLAQTSYYKTQRELVCAKASIENQAEDLAKINALHERQINEMKSAQDDILEESAAAIGQRDQLVDENVRLQQELLLARSGKAAVRSADSGVLGLSREDAPENFEVVRWLATRVFPRLLIVPGAWDMDRKKNNVNLVRILWQMLWSLDRVLAPMLLDPAVGNPVQKFKEKTGFTYAPHDTDFLTKEMKRERVVSFEGRQWHITHHVKYGNEDAKLIRIYFDVDHEQKRLIVGSIGEHLTTLGTSRI